MSLLFGNLTQDFVNFGIAINNLDPNDPESKTELDQAAEKFRHVAGNDASYLTYIGMSPITLLLVTNWYCSCPYRRGLVRFHVHLHVDMGLYLRGGC
jgi:hypothetical protein